MDKKVSFEEKMQHLEKLLSEMETSSLSLDEQVKKYEEGVKLIAECSSELDQVTAKIQEITSRLNIGNPNINN